MTTQSRRARMRARRFVDLRIFCAGFDLPTNVRGALPTLVGGHVFAQRAEAPGTGADEAAAASRDAPPAEERGEGEGEGEEGQAYLITSSMYGTRNEGPRVLLEYALTLDLDAEAAAEGAEDASAAVEDGARAAERRRAGGPDGKKRTLGLGGKRRRDGEDP